MCTTLILFSKRVKLLWSTFSCKKSMCKVLFLFFFVVKFRGQLLRGENYFFYRGQLCVELFCGQISRVIIIFNFFKLWRTITCKKILFYFILCKTFVWSTFTCKTFACTKKFVVKFYGKL